jgi:hypothetical protein
MVGFRGLDKAWSYVTLTYRRMPDSVRDSDVHLANSPFVPTFALFSNFLPLRPVPWSTFNHRPHLSQALLMPQLLPILIV